MSDPNTSVVVNSVGKYLFSEDLCIGIYDGTGFDSGTCIRNDLSNHTSEFKGISQSDMVIRDNAVPLNSYIFSGITKTLDGDNQAQCVMTALDSAMCWVWDASLGNNIKRCVVQVGKTPVCSQPYKRKAPLPDKYSVYVRKQGTSYSSAPSVLSAGKALVVGMLLAAALHV